MVGVVWRCRGSCLPGRGVVGGEWRSAGLQRGSVTRRADRKAEGEAEALADEGEGKAEAKKEKKQKKSKYDILVPIAQAGLVDRLAEFYGLGAGFPSDQVCGVV
jgi:hypothetical protein